MHNIKLLEYNYLFDNTLNNYYKDKDEYPNKVFIWAACYPLVFDTVKNRMEPAKNKINLNLKMFNLSLNE